MPERKVFYTAGDAGDKCDVCKGNEGNKTIDWINHTGRVGKQLCFLREKMMQILTRTFENENSSHAAAVGGNKKMRSQIKILVLWEEDDDNDTPLCLSGPALRGSQVLEESIVGKGASI